MSRFENLEYIVLPSFLGSEEVSALKSKFNETLCSSNSNFIHANVVQLGSDQIENSKVLSSVLEKIKKYYTDTLKVSGLVLNKVWLVKSKSKDTNPNKLPYQPHFDKNRYLKAMIYLHDVDKEHGPIHFGKLLMPSEIDIRRKKLPANYKELGLNIIKPSELKSGLEPILGKGGDVVFFDTNAAHCAGIVSEGYERHVIRIDFDVRGFNPSQSIVKRLFHFISSKIS